jgi:hypothetical protein
MSYLFHGLSFSLAEVMPRFWWAPQKFFEVFAEIGIFVTLVRIIPTDRRNSVFWTFWLNPFFILSGAWLGFWDAPYTLTALLAILAVRAIQSERRSWFVAGILLGLGTLFKPQGLIYFVFPLLVYVTGELLWHRRSIPLTSVIAGGASVFGVAEVLVVLAGGSPLAIPRSYLIGDIMPNLCNSCISVWRPVTRALQLALHQSGPLYELRLPSNISRISDLLILAIAVLLLVAFALRVSIKRDSLRGVKASRNRIPSNQDAALLYMILAFGALVVPQIATRAHISHTYAALVLLIPLATVTRSVLIPWIAMISIHFYGYLSSYGIGAATALPLRDTSGYPAAARALIGGLDSSSHPHLLQFQERTNELILRSAPQEPFLSLLSVLQFVCVLYVVTGFFLRPEWSKVFQEPDIPGLPRSQ